ncbi:ATP-binding protein [Leeia aquatica]|uniref:histidine kinase n=1 Tax=Leeia aquatica TaxID=2725557 RepID=A0A847S3H7_9NEIS|nr:ATP-binding protein [Leeia aquatica]NLR74353.1 hypothetical protein [Leeia aquatica]
MIRHQVRELTRMPRVVSLRYRLGLCFGAILGLLMAVVVVGMLGFEQFRQNTDRLVEEDYPKSQLVDDTLGHLNTIALSMRNTLFLREGGAVQNELDTIAAANARLLTSLKQLHESFRDAEEQAILREIDIVDSAYRVNQDDFIRLIRESPLSEARNLLLVDVHPYQLQYFALLNRLKQHHRQLMLARSKALDSTYYRVNTVMLALTVLALLAGLYLTVRLARSLLRQLGGEPSYAMQVARQIAEGDVHRDIELRPGDQHSLLAVMDLMRHRLNARGDLLEQANMELGTTIEALHQTQQELVEREKMAALGALVAGVAHELNTPVGNGVIAASTMKDLTLKFLEQFQQGHLKRSELGQFLQEMQEGADILERNLLRAGDLVASFKQVAVDCSSIQLRAFSLHELVRETMLTLTPGFKKSPYRFVQDVPDTISLYSYPGPLSQVITNLVSNAVIHGFQQRDHGEVRIQAQVLSDGMVQLSVTDDGYGIPEDALPRIFDPFFTTRFGQGGSGLGLHIVYNNVTQTLGGKIRVHSQPGCTTFTLTLPPRLTPAA